MRVVFMTDLDGTLLGHDDFSFAAIRDGIHALLDAGITIIPNSSKTRAEMLVFCEALGAKLPLICENGAALIHGHLLEQGPASSPLPASLNSDIPALGTDVERLMSAWILGVAHHLRRDCVFLDSMTRSEQSAILGLEGAALDRALQREFSVLLQFKGSPDSYRQLQRQVEKAGLALHRGGRICCLSGRHDKSSFNAVIRARCHDAGRDPVIVGFGDSDNDIRLLCSADVACVVPRPDAPTLRLPDPPSRVITAAEPAPTGWMHAATIALSAITTTGKTGHG